MTSPDVNDCFFKGSCSKTRSGLRPDHGKERAFEEETLNIEQPLFTQSASGWESKHWHVSRVIVAPHINIPFMSFYTIIFCITELLKNKPWNYVSSIPAFLPVASGQLTRTQLIRQATIKRTILAHAAQKVSEIQTHAGTHLYKCSAYSL